MRRSFERRIFVFPALRENEWWTRHVTMHFGGDEKMYISVITKGTTVSKITIVPFLFLFCLFRIIKHFQNKLSYSFADKYKSIRPVIIIKSFAGIFFKSFYKSIHIIKHAYHAAIFLLFTIKICKHKFS